jgi:hypothetical protein
MDVAVEREDVGRVGIAQLERGRRDGVEHGLHVGGRAADHAQDVARCSLLLQRFRQVAIAGFKLLEQDVFDRDDRLVSEGLQRAI